MVRAEGRLFGCGLKVEPQDTPTATITPPTLTPTPVVSSSGSASLEVGQSIDLDAGQVVSGEDAEFILQAGTAQILLLLQNGARMANHGSTVPSLADCQSAALSADPTAIGPEFQGRYLCLQTGKGLPGYMLIEQLDVATGTMNIQYLVWSVP